ncbi:protein A16-like [Anopheles nili]|uniref:protein A16-like n=1 Tax=Anopheles nili TaxID=185578 RepID=UPI00237A76D2|nr:protein A16-like [Anopheles nili]
MLGACIGLSFALSMERTAKSQPELENFLAEISAEFAADARQGRFLEPAYFAVRKKRYFIGTGGVGSFFYAWRRCIDAGKSLATIESEEDQRKLEALTAPYNSDYWIAATSLGNADANLTWITSDLPVLTAPSSLNVNDDSCISLHSSGEWHNNDCFDEDIAYSYLCESYV